MELLKAIIQAIKEVETKYNDDIAWYENKIAGLENEQRLIIKALRENNIETLKNYFNIK